MLELAFSFQNEAKIPHYEQLYLFIRQEIQSGHIQSGTQLPSIRGLSDALKISKTTTEWAYQQLIAEGYIESKSRVGFFVLQPEDTHIEVQSFADDSPSQTPQTVFTPVEIDFHPAQVDGAHFPRAIFRKLMHDIWKNEDDAFLHYGDIYGEWGLRRELAQYLQHSRGVQCTAHQIVIGTGIQYSLHLLIDLLRTDSTVVGIEHPGYDRALSVFQRVHVPTRQIPLESDGINIHALWTSDSNLVYVTPSHQFPLGMVMPYAKRMQLLQWARERNAFIIEDDYDGEFRYEERPIPSLQRLDRNDSVIYIGTFSKSLSPAMRMNYMVLPNPIAQPFQERYRAWDSPVPRYHQIAMQKFMELGHWEKHIRRIRRVYRNKHAVLIGAILREMGDKATIIGHGAGLHVLLKLKSDLCDRELKERAESVGVKVYFPNSDLQEAKSSHTVILGFGGLCKEQIEEGIRRLHLCWFT